MIKLQENRTALINLGTTVAGIENLEKLIEEYSKSSSGPAYCTFNYTNLGDAQIKREFILIALNSQRDHLINYLAGLGIEY